MQYVLKQGRDGPFIHQPCIFLISVASCSEIWKLDSLSDTSRVSNRPKALMHLSRAVSQLFQAEIFETMTPSHLVGVLLRLGIHSRVVPMKLEQAVKFVKTMLRKIANKITATILMFDKWRNILKQQALSLFVISINTAISNGRIIGQNEITILNLTVIK